MIDILLGEKCSAEYDEINILSYAPPLYEIRQASAGIGNSIDLNRLAKTHVLVAFSLIISLYSQLD
jgi:hypothetical protein